LPRVAPFRCARAGFPQFVGATDGAEEHFSMKNKTVLSLALGTAFPWFSGPAFAQAADLAADADPDDDRRHGASRYFTVDLRARYQIDKRWSGAFGIDNANNYQYWNFHPYPQRTYSAELRFDL
jgi:outer membrane receptor protein involved in Fe transport